MCVVGGLTAIDHQMIAACGDAELVARNAGNGLNAEPVVRRQFEQWQLTAYSNTSGTA